MGWGCVVEGVVRWGCAGQLCHTWEVASSSSNRQRGVEAITALAIQHNGLLSPHHQSLSESTPPTHVSYTHTLRCAQTNTCVHACIPRSHRHCGGSLIMQLILSDSEMYNGGFPGGEGGGRHVSKQPPTLHTVTASIYYLTYLAGNHCPI